jgi:cell division initiation protein
MSLTPQDIQTKQFHVRFRGFDVEEVDAFLERIAEEFLILIQENKQLKDRSETLEGDIKYYKEQEKKFQDAILSAHKIAAEMKEKSKKESEELLSHAREDVKKMQNKSHMEISGFEATIVNLKELKDRVHDDVRQLLESYLDRLEEISQGIAIDYVPEPEKKALPPAEEDAHAEEEVESSISETLETTEKSIPEEAAFDSFEPFEEEDDEIQPEKVIDSETAEELSAAELFDEDEPEVVVGEEPEEEEKIVPDLEGDLLFSMEDPLDELESSLTSKEENKKEK